MDVNQIYEPVGCDECLDGYKGRIAIQEVLSVNQEVRDAILSNIRKDKLREIIYKKGHTVTLLQDGLEKVINGLTSFDEVLRVIEVDSDFGEDEKDIKDAILGKEKPTNNENIEDNNNLENLSIEKVETLDF